MDGKGESEAEGDQKTREGYGGVGSEREEAVNMGNDAQAVGDPH